jgi:hypothetical protein
LIFIEILKRSENKKNNQQKVQPDVCFVIKPAKRFMFFTQVLRQFFAAQKPQTQVKTMLDGRFKEAAMDVKRW